MLTLNCSYSNPVDSTGAFPASVTDPWNFASSTCAVVTDSASSTAPQTVDILPTITAGDLVIGLMGFVIIIFLFTGFAVNLWAVKSRKSL